MENKLTEITDGTGITLRPLSSSVVGLKTRSKFRRDPVDYYLRVIVYAITDKNNDIITTEETKE